MYNRLEPMTKATKLLQESQFPCVGLLTFRNQCAINIIRNHCLFTGSTQNIQTSYKLSRHTIRKMVTNGMIVGVKKSIW